MKDYKHLVAYISALSITILTVAVLVLAEKASRPLYYIEGNLIYEIELTTDSTSTFKYDTTRYESCKPYLEYKLAKEGLMREYQDFFAEGYEGNVRPVKADLQIVEYR